MRTSAALLLATLTASVAATHAFVSVDLIRVKPVQNPRLADAGAISVPVSRSRDTERLRPPFAVIARINNETNDTAAFAIDVDGKTVCASPVRAHQATRIDCAVATTWKADADHLARITGPAGRWSLEYLELATHHGRTIGRTELVILPSAADRYEGPLWPWSIATWLLVGWIALAVPTGNRLPVWLLRSHRVLGTLIAVILGAVLISQWVSAYRLIVSVGTLIRWTIWLLAPQLFLLGRALCVPDEANATWHVQVQRRLVVTLVVVVAFVSIVHSRAAESFGGRYSGIIGISQERFDKNPLLNGRNDVRQSVFLTSSGGYDGQFFYFEMFDPLLRAYRAEPGMYRNFIDAPHFRYGRIGFVFLALLASLGQWQWFPTAIIWLVVTGVGVTTYLLATLAGRHGVPPAIAGLVLFVPGFWQSIQVGLPEPIAAAALLGGLLCIERRQWSVAAVLFSLALLIRETSAIAVVCVLAGAFVRGQRREAIVIGAVSFGTVLIWRLYVAWILFADLGLEGFFYHPGDLGVPLLGFFHLWRSVISGNYFPGMPEMSRSAIALPILLTAGFVLAVAIGIKTRHPVAIAAALYGLLAISLDYDAIWVHVGNGQRGTFELFLMLALIGTLGTRTYPLALRRSFWAVWCAASAYVFVFGFDAEFLRRILLPVVF